MFFPSSLKSKLLGGACLLMLFSLRVEAQTNVLFVGNSFTYGHVDPVLSYNNSQVTDANGSGYGGIPGIFKKMTTQAGLSYNVTIEAVGGQDLNYHLSNKAAIIGQPQWNIVILQGLSTEPLPSAHGGNPTGYLAGADGLQDLVLSYNANAKVWLYETWTSPASASAQGYNGVLQAMQDDLTSETFTAKYRSYRTSGKPDFGLVARVGDGFMRCVDQGLADPNNGTTAGQFDLWYSGDNRHPSVYGAYLSAAIWFGKITGVDPRTLPTGTGSPAADFGISQTDAQNLLRIAYETNNLTDPAPVTQPATPTVNTLNAGTNLNWNAAANWSAGALTTSESVLINASSATVSQVANSLSGGSYAASIQSVSFDIGSTTKNVQPNLTTQNPRTLTLTGGTDALGGTDLIHLSSATTGTANIGTNSGFSTLTVKFNVGGNLDVENAAATLNLGAVTILTGNVNLTKTGVGTLTLAGVNTFGAGTGNTVTVQGGTLLANTTASGTASATGAAGVVVSPNGTLGGTGQIVPGAGNGITVQNGGVLAPGAGGIGILTLNGANTTASVLSLTAGAKLSYELNSTGAGSFLSDQIALLNGAAGDLVFGGNTINFADLSSGGLPTGTYTLFTASAASNYSGLTVDANGYITAGLSLGTGLSAYQARLQLSGASLVLALTPLPYTAWKAAYFSAAERQNQSVSGDFATPAGDGVANLLKYAFNVDPHGSAAAVLPTAAVVSQSGVLCLALTFRKSLAATDLSYVVEVSSDLVTWNSGTNYTAVVGTVNNPDGTTQTVQVRALDPRQRFARLRVTKN